MNLLTELGHKDLFATFIDNNFTVDGVMAIEKNELIDLGIKLGQVKEFLLSLEKLKQQRTQEREDERKRSLKLVLAEIKRKDLLDIFIDKKVQLNEVLNLSEDDLTKMGLSYWKRFNWKKSVREHRKSFNIILH